METRIQKLISFYIFWSLNTHTSQKYHASNWHACLLTPVLFTLCAFENCGKLLTMFSNNNKIFYIRNIHMCTFREHSVFAAMMFISKIDIIVLHSYELKIVFGENALAMFMFHLYLSDVLSKWFVWFGWSCNIMMLLIFSVHFYFGCVCVMYEHNLNWY